MDKIARTVAETLRTDYDTALGVLVAGAVGVATLFLILCLVLLRRKGKGNIVILAGLSDAGKSLMFRQLVTGHAPDPPITYTSMRENVFLELTIQSEEGKSATVKKLVDFPGAEKLRKGLFNQYLTTGAGGLLKGVVFVVDSVTFPKMCKDVAELLYEILCEVTPKIPILVACSKQDMALAKSCQVIRSGLEKEFKLLNRTRSAALDSTDDRDSRRRVLASPDGNFSLDHLDRPLKFCECTSKESQNGGLESVEDWLVEL